MPFNTKTTTAQDEPASPNGPCPLQIYLSAAFLLSWKQRIVESEFQELILFLQKLPTAEWTEAQLEPVLARAHVLRTKHPRPWE